MVVSADGTTSVNSSTTSSAVPEVGSSVPRECATNEVTGSAPSGAGNVDRGPLGTLGGVDGGGERLDR